MNIGRQAIARSDAKKLFTEQAANEVRKAQMRAAAEQRAIEQDQQYRRQLYAGIPAGLIPAGLTLPLQCWTAAQAAASASGEPVGGGIVQRGAVFHSFGGVSEEE